MVAVFLHKDAFVVGLTAVAVKLESCILVQPKRDLDNVILEAFDAGGKQIYLLFPFDKLLHDVSEHFYGHVWLLFNLE